MKIFSFKVKKMKLLTKELKESYENAKILYICQEKFEYQYAKDKKYCKVWGYCTGKNGIDHNRSHFTIDQTMIIVLLQ